jgi:flagellar motility protein MotE (MotC chaperone)
VASKDSPGQTLDDAANLKKGGREKKKKSIAPMLVLLGVLAAIAAFFSLNLFGARDNYLYPLLRKIPIAGNLMPDAEMELTLEESKAKIQSLQTQLEKAETGLAEAEKLNSIYAEEIKGLKALEGQMSAFKEEKALFDAAAALQNPEAFAAYYKSMNPDLAEQLYPEAAAATSAVAEARKLASTIEKMDEASAAAALEQLMATDMDLVVLLLKNINAKRTGELLEQMQPKNAASAIKMMAPRLQGF